MTWRLSILAATMTCCSPDRSLPATTDMNGVVDQDGDGVTSESDCDDTDDSIYPGADDPPGDGFDSNCDGVDGTGVTLSQYETFDPPQRAFSLEAGFSLLLAQFDDDPGLECVASAYHFERFDDHADPAAGAAWVLDADGGAFDTLATWHGDTFDVLGEFVAVGRFVGDDSVDDLVISTLNQYYLFDGTTIPESTLDDATPFATTAATDDQMRGYNLSTVAQQAGPDDMLAVAMFDVPLPAELRLFDLNGGRPPSLDEPDVVVPSTAESTMATNVAWQNDSTFEVAVYDHLLGAGTVRVGASADALSIGEPSVIELQAEYPGDWLGTHVSSAPAPDGSEDRVLWVGAMGYPDRQRHGRIYGLRPDERIATASWTITARDDGVHRLGRDFVSADLDSDGWIDLAVGAAADAYTEGLARFPGSVYVFFGPIAPGDYSTDDADLTLVGESPGDMAGWSLVAGDVTGDGQADLVIGAPAHDAADGTEDVGRIYLVPGPLR